VHDRQPCFARECDHQRHSHDQRGRFVRQQRERSRRTSPIPISSNNTDNTGNGGLAAALGGRLVVKTLTTSDRSTVTRASPTRLFARQRRPVDRTNVQVTDTPSNLSITKSPAAVCAALRGTIASLGVGANATITVTATITAAGSFDKPRTSPPRARSERHQHTDSTGNAARRCVRRPFDGQDVDHAAVLDRPRASPTRSSSPPRSVDGTNIQVSDTPTT